MVSKERIEQLAMQHLEGKPLFLTSVKVSVENHISVLIDGDEGVTIADCVALSRAIEGALDRDREDFSLDVSSHGATSPLLMPRQYRRHVGRELEVKLGNGEKLGGKLVEADDTRFAIVYETREAKPVGKGKMTVENRRDLRYDEVKEARIKLKF